MKNKPQNIDQRLRGDHAPRMQNFKSMPAPEQGGATHLAADIPLDQIDEYELNPRQYTNPKYQEIKESIRRTGVQHRVTVTRRPGAERYVISQGGNTRLRCLRELHRETQLEKYSALPCIVKPWVSEMDLMVGHYTENELRGNLNWHEKSAMICHLKTGVEKELGRDLTYRKFAKVAAEHGIQINYREIGLHQYTHERLGQHYPFQLETLNRTIAKELQRAENAILSVWRELRLSTTEFEQQLATEFSRVGEPPRAQKLAKRMGRRIKDQNENFRDVEFSRDVAQHAKHHHYPQPVLQDYLPLPPPDTDVENAPLVQDAADQTEAESADAAYAAAELPSLQGDRIQNQLHDHRTNMANHARKFARKGGCDPKLIEDVSFGYGYLVLQLPPHKEERSAQQRQLSEQIWWLLFELSGIHEAAAQCGNTLRVAQEKNSPFIPFLRSGRESTILQISRNHGLKTPSPLHMTGAILKTTGQHGDDLLNTWSQLNQTYRKLWHLTEQENINLWQ